MKEAQAIGARRAAPMPLVGALSLAEQYRRAGRLSEAEALCRDILSMSPREANAVHLLGLVAFQGGKLADAIAQIRRAVTLAPNVASFHANLGEMYRLAGRSDKAVASGRRALALQPQYPEALSNLGIALYDQKKYEEAAACQRRAIDLKPAFTLAHSNLGNALFALKRFEEAAAAHRGAIALDPGFADAWSNLGITLHHAGHYDEAIAALRRAIALAPDHANAHSGLGILLLMRGELSEGWEEYEWRLRVSESTAPQRPWHGESLAGRHLYVQAEQGFGDTIQFARYLPWLAGRAASVTLRVQPTLLTLLRESLPGIEVLSGGAPARVPDCDCALLSLPRLLKTRLDDIPATVPYLHPPAGIAARWRQRLAAMQGLRVGVVWAGRPEHANDFRRSLELAALTPIFAVPGVAFASLQVGPRAADRKAHPALKILDLASKLADFAETAAAVAALDLVITVDTAVAHLAGALGKPVWLLLPWVTDWRWLIGRDDSPWYPTMRLYRQRQGEAWAEVVARLTAELAAVAHQQNA